MKIGGSKMDGIDIDKVYTKTTDGYKLNSRGRIRIIEFSVMFDIKTFDESDKIMYWATVNKVTGEISVGKFDPDGRIRVPKTWSE